MTFARQIPRILHDEHRATIAVLERLESVLARAKPNTPPPPSNELNSALGDLSTAIEGEIGSHFAFEEQELFSRLRETGDHMIAELLTAEHEIILALGRDVASLARQAKNAGFSEDSWRLFYPQGYELIERMVAHIQKEEMALLPIVDELLDEEQDEMLAMEYAGQR